MTSRSKLADEPREYDRDRRRRLRDAILCAIEDAGQALKPMEIAKRAKVGHVAVLFAVGQWPRYFEITRCAHGRIAKIDRHEHLRATA